MFTPNWERLFIYSNKDFFLSLFSICYNSIEYSDVESGLGLERGPPSVVRTTGQLLDWEVADLIKKVGIIRIDGA